MPEDTCEDLGMLLATTSLRLLGDTAYHDNGNGEEDPVAGQYMSTQQKQIKMALGIPTTALDLYEWTVPLCLPLWLRYNCVQGRPVSVRYGVSSTLRRAVHKAPYFTLCVYLIQRNANMKAPRNHISARDSTTTVQL